MGARTFLRNAGTLLYGSEAKTSYEKMYMRRKAEREKMLATPGESVVRSAFLGGRPARPVLFLLAVTSALHQLLPSPSSSQASCLFSRFLDQKLYQGSIRLEQSWFYSEDDLIKLLLQNYFFRSSVVYIDKLFWKHVEIFALNIL